MLKECNKRRLLCKAEALRKKRIEEQIQYILNSPESALNTESSKISRLLNLGSPESFSALEKALKSGKLHMEDIQEHIPGSLEAYKWLKQRGYDVTKKAKKSNETPLQHMLRTFTYGSSFLTRNNYIVFREMAIDGLNSSNSKQVFQELDQFFKKHPNVRKILYSHHMALKTEKTSQVLEDSSANNQPVSTKIDPVVANRGGR